MNKSFFVTSLGKSRYEPVSYALEGKSVHTRFAPAATARILGLHGASALLLTTADVEPLPDCAGLYDELTDAGLAVEVIQIGQKGEADDLMRLLGILSERIPDGSRLTLDVTYGLRHLPFLYHAALTFLCGLRKVTLEGIYYGALELKQPDGTVPLISIGHTFDLIAWFQAMRTFRESGDAKAIARSLSHDVKKLFAANVQDRHLSQLKDAANRLAEALGFGLPLEAGIEAAHLCKAAEHLETSSPGASSSHLGADLLRSAVEGWELDRSPDKATVVLDQNEIERQLTFADWLLERGELGNVLAVLREFIVNVTLVVLRTADRWLDRNQRFAAERYLNGLSERSRSHLPTSPVEKQLASAWDAVRDRRNHVAHSGMISTDARVSAKRVQQLLSSCQHLLGISSSRPVARGTGSLLVSPLGLSPGVLFSALKRTKPDRLLVITSDLAVSSLEEVLRASGFMNIEHRIRKLKDAHAGFSEDRDLIDAEVDRDLIESAQVIINITGGTTALQWLVDRVAERAVSLGARVTRVALIDRRPATVQQQEPYEIGELVELASLEHIASDTAETGA